MPTPPVICAVRAHPLRAHLLDPFVIANARLDHVDNVAVQVVLDDGSEGWGEIGVLPPITAETSSDARAVVDGASLLEGLAPTDPEIPEILASLAPRFKASRAGIEVACFDAAARSLRQPLWRSFGERCSPVVTDITLPIGTPARAKELASRWRALGFEVLKVKVGIDIEEDIARIEAIAQGHPDARLVLDANEGYTVRETLRAVAASRACGLQVVLLEQPVPRGDLDALAELTATAQTLVCADEACQSAKDAEQLGRERRASAVNIKIAKCGVREALQIVEVARRYQLATMVGAMVETRIGTSFSAHFAAGIGGFSVIDLDTALLMTSDPVEGGTALSGPVWRVDTDVIGHGGRPVTLP